MTIEQLAHAIGRAPATIYNWNSGITSPNRNDMQNIAALFNTTAHLLFFDETDTLYPTG